MHDRLTRAVDLHTVLGMFGGLGAWLMQHSSHISLGLQWLGGIAGLALATVSLAIKIRQYRTLGRE